MQLVIAFLCIFAGFSIPASAQNVPAVPVQPTTTTVPIDRVAAAPAASTGAAAVTGEQAASSESSSVVASFADLVAGAPSPVVHWHHSHRR